MFLKTKTNNTGRIFTYANQMLCYLFLQISHLNIQFNKRLNTNSFQHGACTVKRYFDRTLSEKRGKKVNIVEFKCDV